MRKRVKQVTREVLPALLAVVLLAGASAHATWQPHDTVQILVGVGAGGAHDRTARLVQAMWQKTRNVPVSVVITNKPGGGGTRAWTELSQAVGKPHYLAITGPTLLTNKITGITPLSYSDFTQVAVLYSEAIAFAVSANSRIKDGRELARRLVTDPSSLVVGIATARGNTNHIAMASMTKAAGGDPRKLRVVVFDSGGKVVTALMGGHVDVVASNASNLVAQASKTKGLRLLAVSAPERVAGALADVPTWKELGVNSVVANFRGVMAPKGLAAEHVSYWERAFQRLTEQEDWKREVRDNCGYGSFLGNAAAIDFLKEEYTELQNVLRSLDMVK
jgi:Uncharacterized protein conserved in bacteria